MEALCATSELLVGLGVDVGRLRRLVAGPGVGLPLEFSPGAGARGGFWP